MSAAVVALLATAYAYKALRCGVWTHDYLVRRGSSGMVIGPLWLGRVPAAVLMGATWPVHYVVAFLMPDRD